MIFRAPAADADMLPQVPADTNVAMRQKIAEIEGDIMSLSPAQKYGAVAALAVFIVGWTTGMGGSILPNAVFSIVMGAFAGFLFSFIQKRFDRK